MSSVQERLKLKRAQIDTWSIREKLCLASAVLRSGDQNWMSVSRSLKAYGDAGRPADWFSQKSCAVQYSGLLENVETPKRKKRTDKGEASLETPSESIARRLTEERIEELKRLLNEDKLAYAKLKEDVLKVKSGVADDKLDDMVQDIEEERKQKVKKAEAHEQWLREREEKKIELERAWKPPVALASPHKRKQPKINRRNSTHSEPSSEAESSLDTPLSEPLNVDVIGEENAIDTVVETKPSQTPTSPLLTSLLKSPSPAPTSQVCSSSILHSAITSHRGASPTITSLLSSAPSIPGTGNVSVAPPNTVSPSLKNLVSSAISSEQPHHQPPPHNPSPAAGAPTLSMLLELPPSLPGKPLPELPSAINTTTSPSTVSAIVSAASTLTTKDKLASLRTVPATAPCNSSTAKIETPKVAGGDVEMPQISQEFKIADSTNKEEIELQVESTHNFVDTHLPNDSKEELIEEVLIEEVVVNDDEDITSEELLSTEISDVVVDDEGEVKVKKEKKDFKIQNQFIEVTQSSETSTSTSPKKETKIEVASDVDSTSNNSVSIINNDISHIEEVKNIKEHEAVVETSAQELVSNMMSQEDTNVDVPDTEVELSTETVTEVIEITDGQETSIQTDVDECEPCLQELENMEVIILDKVQDLDEVHIVEDMKELGCEVVEVVMGGHEKVEVVKEEPEESISESTKSEDFSSVDLCTATPESSVDNKSSENDKLNGMFGIGSNEDVGDAIVDDITFRDSGKLNVSKPTTKSNSVDEQDVEIHVRDDLKTAESLSIEVKEAKETDKNVIGDDKLIRKNSEEAIVSFSLTKHHIEKSEDVPSEHPVDSSQVKATDVKYVDVTQNRRKSDNFSVQKTEVEESLKSDIRDDREITILKKESLPDVITEVPNSESKRVDHGNKDLKKGPKESLNSRKETLTDLKRINTKDDAPEKDIVPSEVLSQNISEMIKEGKEKNDLVGKDKHSSSELVKRTNSKDEKVACKEPIKKDTPRILESNKNISKEHVSKEIREKELARKDVDYKDVASKETGKDSCKEEKKETSVNECNRKEDHVQEPKKAIPTKESVKKDLSFSKKDFATHKREMQTPRKEFPGRETSRETGKRDYLRRDKEDSSRKDCNKRTISKDDKKEVAKDEGRKRPNAKEVVRPSKKSISEPKDSESSKPEVERVLKKENDIWNDCQEKKGEGMDSDFSKACDDVKIKLEQTVPKEGNPAELKVKFGESDKILSTMQKEGKEQSKAGDIKLELIEHPEEKYERRVPLRAETPSTEDDKTNDAEPMKAASRKRVTAISAMDSVPNSPASTTDEEREYKSWKKSIMLLYGRLATHKYASLFLRPITDEQAPGYSSIVHRPIDLLTIKKNIETGVIRNTLEFQRDVMLMFLNSIMYNKSSHFVHKMALQMQSEGMQHIQDYLTTQMLVQVAGDGVPIRRETRTTEANKQREMLSNPSTSTSQEEGDANQAKRKRIVGPDVERGVKKKKVDE